MRRFFLVLVVPVVVGLALPAVAAAKTRLTTLRSMTDQNQPLVLRVDRRRHRLRVRFDLLVTSCRGRGSDRSVFGAPRATTVRRNRWIRLTRGGRARTSYLAQRTFESNGDRGDGSLGTRVIFRAKIKGRRVSGTLRVRISVRENLEDEDGVKRFRFKCDSRTRKFHGPRMKFKGPWLPTGPLSHPSVPVEQAYESLVPLADGRVLLAGGNGKGNDATAAAALFRPRSGQWQRVSSLRHARLAAGAVRLGDGRVLVVGGSAEGFDRPLSSVEIFNPGTRRWTDAAPLRVARQGPAAALLSDGRVLVTGSGGGTLDSPTSTEIYDPARNTWTPAAPLPGPYGGDSDDSDRPLGVPLSGNRVLVVNGPERQNERTFTVYSAATNSWTKRRPVSGFYPADWSGGAIDEVVALPGGRVLAVGCGTGPGAAAAIFSGTAWRAVAPPPFCAQGAARLPSGHVLLAGARPALYDPARNTWTAAPGYRFPHPDTTGLTASPSANLLAPIPSGALLVGSGLNRYSSTERFFEP